MADDDADDAMHAHAWRWRDRENQHARINTTTRFPITDYSSRNGDQLQLDKFPSNRGGHHLAPRTSRPRCAYLSARTLYVGASSLWTLCSPTRPSPPCARTRDIIWAAASSRGVSGWLMRHARPPPRGHGGVLRAHTSDLLRSPRLTHTQFIASTTLFRAPRATAAVPRAVRLTRLSLPPCPLSPSLWDDASPPTRSTLPAPIGGTVVVAVWASPASCSASSSPSVLSPRARSPFAPPPLVNWRRQSSTAAAGSSR